MREGKYFAVVLCTLVTGFGIGFAAGLSEPIKHEIQWETLLAGAAAIIGGWMAYRGAMAPFLDEKQRITELYLHTFREEINQFLRSTDEKSKSGKLCLDMFRANKTHRRDDMITAMAMEILTCMPEIPEKINTAPLRQKLVNIRYLLARFNPEDRKFLGDFLPPDPIETRNAILEYAVMVESLC
jgi:hypothetical protein